MEDRRFDPESSRVVNIKNLPSDLSPELVSKWIQSPKDVNVVLDERFKEYESTEKELKKNYGIKSSINPTGIFHSISSESIGEEEEYSEKVFDLIQGHLLRPVPSTLVK